MSCTRALLLLGGMGLIGGSLAYSYRVRLLYWLGQGLLAHVPLAPPWDGVVVFSGRPYERALAAAQAYQQYPTRIIALGGNLNEDLLALGVEPYKECALTRQALRSLCVPDSAIYLACEGTSTLEEMAWLAHLCKQKGWRRILLVSSAFHGRRIVYLAQRYLTPQQVAWGFLPAPSLRFRPERWWESEAGLLTLWEEYAKVWYYRWRGYF